MMQKMLPFIGIAMQSRGRDAWGCSNGTDVLRYTGELTDTWGDAREAIETWKAGIFHTRGASCGDRNKVENAHPFSYPRADGDMIIGIHNGIISNHTELDKKYKRNCDVDSMHIWMHRAEGRDWDDLEGWGNLAWWETSPKGNRCINLARFHSENLHVVQLVGGEFAFASELAPLRMVAKMLGNPVRGSWVLDEYHHYWFANDKDGKMTIWRSEKRLPFRERYSSASDSTMWDGYGVGFVNAGGPRRGTPTRPPVWGNLDGHCGKCGNTRINTKDNLLCTGCLGLLMTEFLSTKDSRVITPAAGVSSAS